MYRKFKGMGSSSSPSVEKKKEIDGDEFVSMDRAQREGNAELRKQENVSKIILDFAPGNKVPLGENSLDLEFRHASSKKASRAPIKSLINKELSKEAEIRRSSPSLVARLMGLDTLPPVFTKHQKEKGVTSQKNASVEFHDKHKSSKGPKPLQKSNNAYQECKDVFEVTEMPKLEKKHNKPSQKEMAILEQSEIDLKPNTGLAFAKQKFMDDEFHYCQEYDDALEDLDSNEDLFMKFLQEPKVFKRHLHDLKCSPLSPHENHITILKPSKVTKPDYELRYRSERITDRPSRLPKGYISSPRKYSSVIINDSVKEHSSSIPCNSSEPIYEGKIKDHLHSSPIVILKPSLNEAWGTATTVPLARSPENYQDVLKRQERFPVSRRSEVYVEGMEMLRLFDSLEVMGHKTKRLREIARDVTKQLRSAGSSSSKSVASSNRYGYIRPESSHGMPGMGNFSLESSRWISNQLYDHHSLGVSSYYSPESSVSREARKRLSERWKIIKRVQDVGSVDKGSGTLGEMLVSDKDLSRATPNTSIIQSVSVKSVARDEIRKIWDCPLSISSEDGWNDEWSRNLPRLNSLPPSLACRNPKPTRRNRVGISNSGYPQNVLNKSPPGLLDRNISQRRSSVQTLNYDHYAGAPFYSSGEESEMYEREIHVNSEELSNKNHVRGLGGEVCMVPELFKHTVAGRGHEGESLAPQCQDVKFSPLDDDERAHKSTELPLQVNGEFSSPDPFCLKRKEISVDRSQICSESPFPARAKLDRVSPVSVLELQPSEEDKSSSECFEKINADLNELRMQLKLLKSESADTNAEVSELISSDEDIGEELIEAFRDDEDRDFSYLLDVFIASGVHCTSANEFHNPVNREVYEKLEKKYNILSSWPIYERMLLFDLISHNLADVMKSKRYRPIWAREDIVEEVWQMVMKQRNKSSGVLEDKLLLDPAWLDLRDDVDIVGMDLERMLADELVEELLCQLN